MDLLTCIRMCYHPTVMETTLIRTEARFECFTHNIRLLIAGDATAVYATLFDLQDTHRDCNR